MDTPIEIVEDLIKMNVLIILEKLPLKTTGNQ